VPSPPTLQLDLPDGAQTVKVGDTLLGNADSVILAVLLVPLLSQTQMAYLTVVCGSTELMPWRVWIFRHKVPGRGVGLVVGVGVADRVGVGVAVRVGVGVELADGDLSVPPGVRGFELVLCAGAGTGAAVPGAADEPGTGCGRVGELALGLGWVLGGVGVVLAEATRTASAKSTGMSAGCWARPLAWLAVRVLWSVPGTVPAAVVLSAGLLAVLGAGLLAAEDTQAFVLAWLVSCTPVSIMLTAP
jgi:hypothetical protein